MPQRVGPASRFRPGWPGAAISCAVLALLAGCAGPGAVQGGRFAARHYRYPPPGPPDDPWGPYIREAALRFGVPEQWVRAVMRQESGGRDDAISSAGAMGLMQVMPDTYALLRARYGLGDDPYEPHDNIMAGAAYIRELYDRYGAPGFLAAYNAGPQRLDAYLANGTPLPNETVGYLSSITPRLGSGTTLSGPLAMFAGNESASPAPVPVQVAATSASASCDPNAAYDPDHPCEPTVATTETAVPPAVYNPPPSYPSVVQASAEPRRALTPPLVFTPTPDSQPPLQLASLRPAPRGAWAIQVGAFSSPTSARTAAESARESEADLLSAGVVEAPPTTPFGGAVLYRARIVALSENAAATACARLSERGTACMTVPPGR